MTPMSTFRLGDLGAIVTGRTPPAANPEYFGSEVPFLTPTDIDGVSRHIATGRFLSEVGASAFQRILLPPQSVCCVCIGATIGKVCLTQSVSASNQQINSIIVDRAHHDPRFVYYKLVTLGEVLKAHAGGAATPIVNKSQFSDLEVDLPDVAIQSRTADLLSAYDDLIENNNRRIAILEEMARRIFEEWFVHFRAPGCEGPPMVDSAIGHIPQGWEAAQLGAIARVQWGDTTKTKKSYVASGYDAYSAAGMDGFLDYYDFDHSGIVLSAIGANCGQTWMAYGKWSCIKNTITLWSTVPDICDEYLYLATSKKEFWPRRGAAQPFISQGDARTLHIVKPPSDISTSFAKIAQPALKLRHSLTRQNRNLRAQRDLLLAKLISGEIEVSAPSAALPEAAE
jgi:type I restriction enzyme, S subunit